MRYSDGGKGSAPRQHRDERAYADGYSRIFGKSKLEQRLEQELAQQAQAFDNADDANKERHEQD